MSNQEQISAKGNTQNAAALNKLPEDVVTRLSEKLSELMGEDISGELNRLNNGRGELLNEEGLPIIDITEPVETSTIEDDENVGFVEEPTLPPLHLLQEVDRERLRQERNRLLDQLEEEERMQQRREESADMEHTEEMLRRQKEEAAKAKEKLKATKEMHKKMGRVLLQNLAKEREHEEKVYAADVAFEEAKRASQGGKNKKTVSFADTIEDELASKGKRTADWGDITPARLRATGRPSLLSSSDNLPMKMTVVERVPTAPPKFLTKNEPDSDDESDLEARMDDDEDSDPEATLENEEYDADFAHLQREVALQYHEKREKIGAAALAALKAHSHDGNGDVRVDIPLDMPSSETEKPSISRFKASRLASSYAASSPSTSIGASVVPASAARTIQKAVRTGKLDANDQLVGDDADSASEDETTEGAQELLDLLKKGELYNIGPDGNYVHVAPSNSGQHTAEPSSVPSAIGRAIPKNLPPIDRPKTSKFKISRTTGQSSDSLSSRSSTPVSVAGRSSPKMPPMANSVVERIVPLLRPTMNSTEQSPPGLASIVSNTVSDQRQAPSATQIVPSSAFPSMIVDSPSFPAPVTARVSATSDPAYSPISMTNDDLPSFSKPTTPEVRSRPTRPPRVVSSIVQETSRPPAGVDSIAPQSSRTGRVSRFMAERT